MFNTLARLSLAGIIAIASFAQAAEPAPENLRIGYQKGSVSMVLLKAINYWKNATRTPIFHGASFLRGHKCWKP